MTGWLTLSSVEKVRFNPQGELVLDGDVMVCLRTPVVDQVLQRVSVDLNRYFMPLINNGQEVAFYNEDGLADLMQQFSKHPVEVVLFAVREYLKTHRKEDVHV